MNSPRDSDTRSRWARRAWALCLGLFLTPFALEAALRLAGLFVEGSRAGAARGAAVLCQGDSFTFGLYLPPESAYPARLEALLREAGDSRACVVNAGIPSKPTWILRRELDSDIQRFHPRIALLLAGVNDRWRRRPDGEDAEARGPTPRPWRVVMTLQWIRAQLATRPASSKLSSTTAAASDVDAAPSRPADAPNADTLTNFVPTSSVTKKSDLQQLKFHDRTGTLREFDILAGAPTSAEFCRWIEEDMSAAVQIAREAGVAPVLLAYPGKSPNIDAVNASLARVARTNAALFIDCRPEFERAIRAAGSRALFFPDQHTTAVGAELTARVVLRELARARLVNIAVESVPNPLGAIEGWKEPALAVELVQPDSGEPPTHLRVRYATGYGAVLFVSGARGATPVDFPGPGDVKVVSSDRPNARLLPLANDELFAATLRGNEQRTQTLGSDSSALLEIPWEAIESAQMAGDGIFAAVAIVLPKVGPVLAVSEAVSLGNRKRR